MLGTFTLTERNSSFIETNFDSVVTFTLPVVISGGPSNTFDANVIGLVGRSVAGAVLINFGNAPQHFTFSSSQYSGSFDFAVNNILFGVVGYRGTSTVTWQGQITIAVEVRNVTEPGSLALLGTGLAFHFCIEDHLEPSALKPQVVSNSNAEFEFNCPSTCNLVFPGIVTTLTLFSGKPVVPGLQTIATIRRLSRRLRTLSY